VTPRKRRCFLLGMLISAVIVKRWLFPVEPDLLQRATKLIEVESASSYSWLSASELLVQTKTPETAAPQGSWAGYFELVEPRTGKRTLLKGLTAAIMARAAHYDARTGPLRFERSPDGQWLLWICNGPASQKQKFVTARIDGSGYHEWPAQVSPHWIEGSHWGVSAYAGTAIVSSKLVPRYRLVVHDAAHPGPDIIPQPSSAESQMVQRYAAARSRVTQAQGLYATAFGMGDHFVLNVTRVSKEGPANQPPIVWDTLPYPGGLWSQEVDARKARLVILYHEAVLPTWQAILSSRFRSGTDKRRPAASFYIYTADSRELRKIGQVAETSPSPDNPNVQRPEWMPDGKHIRFFCKNAIYTAPVD
jgi:hypothetical protein